MGVIFSISSYFISALVIFYFVPLDCCIITIWKSNQILPKSTVIHLKSTVGKVEKWLSIFNRITGKNRYHKNTVSHFRVSRCNIYSDTEIGKKYQLLLQIKLVMAIAPPGMVKCMVLGKSLKLEARKLKYIFFSSNQIQRGNFVNFYSLAANRGAIATPP